MNKWKITVYEEDDPLNERGIVTVVKATTLNDVLVNHMPDSIIGPNDFVTVEVQRYEQIWSGDKESLEQERLWING